MTRWLPKVLLMISITVLASACNRPVAEPAPAEKKGDPKSASTGGKDGNTTKGGAVILDPVSGPPPVPQKK